jgi:glycosyltransferase involved in cell wall biosynthesis
LIERLEALSDTEIIVMDNGSSDNTDKVLDEFRDMPNLKCIRLPKNYGLNAYKKLFRRAKGKYVVIVDDDVLAFPDNLVGIFEEYMTAFPDYGFLAMDVIQNEHTNGAKPGVENYTEVDRAGRIVQTGPTGGWLACFRRNDYRKIQLIFRFKDLSMKSAEDGILSQLFSRWLKLKSGVIKDVFCFHASGPFYSKEAGYLDRDIEKYRNSDLGDFVKMYEKFK